MRKLIIAAFLALACSPALAQQPVTSCIQPASHNGSCATEESPVGVSTAIENGHLIKSGAGVLAGFQVNNWGTSAGVTVMAIDASAIPANTTLAACTGTPAQTNPCVMKWYGVATAPSASQSSTLAASWAPGPFLHYFNGLVLVCSSTGPYVLTLSANCTFSGEVQ